MTSEWPLASIGSAAVQTFARRVISIRGVFDKRLGGSRAGVCGGGRDAMRCESSLGWKCCIGLTETVALISSRFNGLAQATPRFNRLAELAACVPLAPMPCGNQLEVAGNIEGAVAERILLSVLLSISCKDNECPCYACKDAKKICYQTTKIL
jgi:hypothetical protein